MRTVLSFTLLAALGLPAVTAAAQSDSDVAAAKRISSYLEQSGQLRNYRIGVSYDRGVATLNGSVTSAEQRDAAIRLAKTAPGVSNVVCQLQCPNAPASGNQPPRSMAGALGEARVAAAQSGPPQVTHAYRETRIAGPAANRMAPPRAFAQPNGLQRGPMLARSNQRMQRPRPMRGNMPLPAPRPGMNAPMRPMRDYGVQPTAGSCPDGSCGPGGPGMYAPDDGMGGMGMEGSPAPMGFVPQSHGRGPSYENAQMPGYAWPSYASYPNYAALTYPRQYSPTAWPYIGPFYPYPQVPLAWRKVSLEWDDGWWFLDFSAHNSSH